MDRQLMASNYFDGMIRLLELNGINNWFDMNESIRDICPNLYRRNNNQMEMVYQAKKQFELGNMGFYDFTDIFDKWILSTLEMKDLML